MNELKLIPDKHSVSADNSNLVFQLADLENVGCRNCVWHLHNQCPHDTEFRKKEIICEELLHFLVSLGEGNGSVSSVWEKFYVYKARLQESADYADFIRLQNSIKEKEGTACSDDELDKLRMQRTSAKLWWARLNEHVVKSLQKIVDREQKSSEISMPGILSAGTINFNITKKDAFEQISDKTNKEVRTE